MKISDSGRNIWNIMFLKINFTLLNMEKLKFNGCFVEKCRQQIYFMLLAFFLLTLVAPSVQAVLKVEPSQGYRIQGAAKVTLKKKTLMQCTESCLAQKKFQCKGFDLSQASGDCRLSARGTRGAASSKHDFYRVSGSPAETNFRISGSACWGGAEKNGALCYKKCKPGFNGVGPVCWERCRRGYKNDGAFCRKPVNIKKKKSYGRGVGKPMVCSSKQDKDAGLCYKKCKSGYKGRGPICWKKCPDGYKNDGATCRKPVKIISKKSYVRGRGKVFKKNCNGKCQKDAGLWYKECKDGYKGRGPVCWQRCKDGYKNDGATCRRKGDIFSKKSYGRGVGKALNSCSSGKEKDAGLCYKKCKSGYKGRGPVCWQKCPDGFKNDGATCRRKGKIITKKSYGRGAGYLQRANYRRIFKRYIRDNDRLNRILAKPLRAAEKTALSQWYPASVLDRVRVVEQAGMTGAFNFSASATTYSKSLVVIKKGRRSVNLLKHELVHICQYTSLGRDGFAKEYADQWIDGGYSYNNIKLEKDAFNFAGSSNVHINAFSSGNGNDKIYSTCK